MSAESQKALSRSDFLICGWRDAIEAAEKEVRFSSSAFYEAATRCEQTGDLVCARILRLIGYACSMMLVPGKINYPFAPVFQDFQNGKRSAIPEDFTPDDISFFDSILDDLEEPWLKARVADVLWLCRKPRNRTHAAIAIDAYISYPIDTESWQRYVRDLWERAGRLCLQISDRQRLSNIENEIYAAFQLQYPEYPLMVLSLAQVLDRLGLGRNHISDIGQRLFLMAEYFRDLGDFRLARSHAELAVKKYAQCEDENGGLDSLALIADSFEGEGDRVSLGSRDSPVQFMANALYENAIQAWRRIPVKHRVRYAVEKKMRQLRDKLAESGVASLGQMGVFRTPAVDIADIVEAAQAHVSGKPNIAEALIYFAGLYKGPDYVSLKEKAGEAIRDPLVSLFSSTHMSADGRVTAKTPALGLGDMSDQVVQPILEREMLQSFSFEMPLVVESQILPALHQVLMEHRVTREFLVAMCYHSPLVLHDRLQLTASALQLGFEYDFSNAVHLLCPQLEHMVRMQLKNAGAHTSNVDKDGLENEIGFSALLDIPEATDVFGPDLLFELRSVFADARGPNLRNEVAHGLLDDNTASGPPSVYAWWMVLRMIIGSLRALAQAS